MIPRQYCFYLWNPQIWEKGIFFISLWLITSFELIHFWQYILSKTHLIRLLCPMDNTKVKNYLKSVITLFHFIQWKLWNSMASRLYWTVYCCFGCWKFFTSFPISKKTSLNKLFLIISTLYTNNSPHVSTTEMIVGKKCPI